MNAELGSVVNFSAVDQFNNAIPFGPFLGVGENRFTFLSDPVQFITSLSLTSNAGQFALQDVRQVRTGSTTAAISRDYAGSARSRWDFRGWPKWHTEGGKGPLPQHARRTTPKFQACWCTISYQPGSTVRVGCSS